MKLHGLFSVKLLLSIPRAFALDDVTGHAAIMAHRCDLHARVGMVLRAFAARTRQGTAIGHKRRRLPVSICGACGTRMGRA